MNSTLSIIGQIPRGVGTGQGDFTGMNMKDCNCPSQAVGDGGNKTAGIRPIGHRTESLRARIGGRQAAKSLSLFGSGKTAMARLALAYGFQGQKLSKFIG